MKKRMTLRAKSYMTGWKTHRQSRKSYRVQMILDCRDELLTTCMALIKNLAEREKMKSVSFQLSMRQQPTNPASQGIDMTFSIRN